jgi:hypothetical protein
VATGGPSVQERAGPVVGGVSGRGRPGEGCAAQDIQTVPVKSIPKSRRLQVRFFTMFCLCERIPKTVAVALSAQLTSISQLP